MILNTYRLANVGLASSTSRDHDILTTPHAFCWQHTDSEMSTALDGAKVFRIERLAVGLLLCCRRDRPKRLCWAESKAKKVKSRKRDQAIAVKHQYSVEIVGESKEQPHC